LLATNKTLTRH